MKRYKRVRVVADNLSRIGINACHRLLVYSKRTRNMRDTMFYLFRKFGVQSVHTDASGKPIPIHDDCYLPVGKYAADNDNQYSLQCWEVWLPHIHAEQINNEFCDCLDLDCDKGKPIVKIEFIQSIGISNGMGKTSAFKDGNMRRANPVVHSTGEIGEKHRDIKVAPFGRLTVKPKSKPVKQRRAFKYTVIHSQNGQFLSRLDIVH